jgi:hypothetical protein
VYLSAASKAIMQKWYYMARNRMRTRFGRSPKRAGVRHVSSDDENDDVMTAAPWARQPVMVSAATVAIARKWLGMARVSRAERRGSQDRQQATYQDLVDERVKRSQAISGTKSRYSRK